ncbi:MAG: hypothetical protein RQ733_12185 [Methyloprofundus sp.]|nr:hypothetical protein [Methyloprofundus sp.]MDT8426716.1 hypothetical protein [Methyloprofundus sp.]
MIIWAINLLVLSIGILIVGLIKPNWLLFWMEKPSRFIIVAASIVLFMAAAVLFGEGNRQGAPLSEVVKQNKPVATEIPSDLVK